MPPSIWQLPACGKALVAPRNEDPDSSLLNTFLGSPGGRPRAERPSKEIWFTPI